MQRIKKNVKVTSDEPVDRDEETVEKSVNEIICIENCDEEKILYSNIENKEVFEAKLMRNKEARGLF